MLHTLEVCKQLSLKSASDEVEALIKQHTASKRDVGERFAHAITSPAFTHQSCGQITNHQTNNKDVNDKFSSVLLPFYESAEKVRCCIRIASAC